MVARKIRQYPNRHNLIYRGINALLRGPVWVDSVAYIRLAGYTTLS